VLQRLSSMEFYFVEAETVYVGHFDDINVTLDIRQDNNNNIKQFLSLKNRSLHDDFVIQNDKSVPEQQWQSGRVKLHKITYMCDTCKCSTKSKGNLYRHKGVHGHTLYSSLRL
jgi:hypothetical protein